MNQVIMQEFLCFCNILLKFYKFYKINNMNVQKKIKKDSEK